MDKEAILKKINNIFTDIFDNDGLEIKTTTTAADIDGWDSLKHINIIAAVEDEFDLKFRMDEILNLKDVGSIIDIVIKRSSC